MEPVSNRWRLTKEGFDRLLDSLDPDREAAALRYEMVRSKLINYFDWRDCPFPEEHADEAINRVIRKLDEGEQFRDLSTYILGIARMMLLEIGRARNRELSILDHPSLAQRVSEEAGETDWRAGCLEKCLAALPGPSRELITEYYGADGPAKIKRRKELAGRLGLQLNALRIRACRVRMKLEECMAKCLCEQGQE
jgi:DNA-directed RNA polymerase specialized sigma24 family protein